MRNLFVTILGVIPASFLCLFVLPGLLYAIGDYSNNGDSALLITILYCVLAVFGTFALFFSIDKPPGPLRMVGLACGIVAMYGLDGLIFLDASLWGLFFIGPVVIAILLIVEGVYTLSSEDDESDHWMR